MVSYKTARTIQTIIAIILIVGVIVGLAFAVRVAMSRNTTRQADTSEESLLSTTADRAVKFTVRGPIVANEDFRSYQITVTPNSRTLTVYEGYLKNVSQKITKSNNVAAYKQFVYALNDVGFMSGSQSSDENDVNGVCATSYAYEFEIIQDGETLKKLWTSKCSSARGTANGSLSSVEDLFIVQIPGGEDIIDEIW